MSELRGRVTCPVPEVDLETGRVTGDGVSELDIDDLWELVVDDEGPEVVIEQWLTEAGWGDPQVQDNHGDLEVVGLDPETGRPTKAWVQHVLPDWDLASRQALQEVVELYQLDGCSLESNLMSVPLQQVGHGDKLLVFDHNGTRLLEDLVRWVLTVAAEQGVELLVIGAPAEWQPPPNAQLEVCLDEPDWLLGLAEDAAALDGLLVLTTAR